MQNALFGIARYEVQWTEVCGVTARKHTTYVFFCVREKLNLFMLIKLLLIIFQQSQ